MSVLDDFHPLLGGASGHRVKRKGVHIFFNISNHKLTFPTFGSRINSISLAHRLQSKNLSLMLPDNFQNAFNWFSRMWPDDFQNTFNWLFRMRKQKGNKVCRDNSQELSKTDEKQISWQSRYFKHVNFKKSTPQMSEKPRWNKYHKSSYEKQSTKNWQIDSRLLNIYFLKITTNDPYKCSKLYLLFSWLEDYNETR